MILPYKIKKAQQKNLLMVFVFCCKITENILLKVLRMSHISVVEEEIEKNEKTEIFKDWCKENEHKLDEKLILPVNMAKDAITELEERLLSVRSSLFGDGWYSGFLDAKKRDNNGEDLDDYNEDDILLFSEHAESECEAGERVQWGDKAPNKAGVYWYWSGEEKDSPIVLKVSEFIPDPSQGFFVESGQLGFPNPEFCNKIKGYWAACLPPSLNKLNKV